MEVPNTLGGTIAMSVPFAQQWRVNSIYLADAIDNNLVDLGICDAKIDVCLVQKHLRTCVRQSRLGKFIVSSWSR
jgi:hypothetical protein